VISTNTRWAKSRYTVYSIYVNVYLLLAHSVQSENLDKLGRNVLVLWLYYQQLQLEERV